VKITVNPSTEASSFGYVPAGKYKLRVVKVTHTTGEKTDYLKWEFELADPNLKSTDGKSKPGHIFENTMLREDIQFKLRGVIDALGMEWADFDTENVAGAELEANLKIGEYEGVMRNEIGRFIPVEK